jgi:hypothetical protein
MRPRGKHDRSRAVDARELPIPLSLRRRERLKKSFVGAASPRGKIVGRKVFNA